MRVDEVIQQPGVKERLLKEDILKSIRVAFPGEIEKYYPETRTAIIQPVIREWNCKDNPPLLLDVPVFFPGNFTFTPQKGDGCLVVCADSCIDSWFQNGGVSTPIVSRTHSMSDGFAFVGFRQTGGIDLGSTLSQLTRELEGKADKVSGATANNFVSLDANGNIKDSGKKPSDFLTSADIENKADKVSGATANNFAGLDSNGNLKDSGKKASDFLTASDITGKKNTQTAVSDPTASGTSLSFIATISQDTQGVISPTKKSVNVVNNLSQTEEGAVLDARQGKVINDKIVHKYLGSFDTEAKLITALNGQLDLMGNYNTQFVRFDFTTATTNFRANHYYGTLSRAGAATHGVLMLTNVSTVIAPVNGAKTDLGWTFKAV